VAVLAPHTDDGELGCGATVSKLIHLGHEVHYVAFCTCNENLPDGYPNGTLEAELHKALNVLGVKQSNRHVYDFTVRRLSYNRQEVLDKLVAFDRKVGPNVVFAPSVSDLHQDHSTVAQEAFRAFKTKTLLAYELPWNNIEFNSNCLVKIDEANLRDKVSSLLCYKSQQKRPYMSEEFVRSLARVRGATIGTTYAEAFTLLRAVLQ